MKIFLVSLIFFSIFLLLNYLIFLEEGELFKISSILTFLIILLASTFTFLFYKCVSNNFQETYKNINISKQNINQKIKQNIILLNSALESIKIMHIIKNDLKKIIFNKEKSLLNNKQVILILNDINNIIEKCTQLLGDIMSSMEKIRDANIQTNDIKEIIKSISDKTILLNEIVNTTHLLSLNASIEASKANTFGIGFSIIADEVGILAIKSRKTTEEISKYLSCSEKKFDKLLEQNEQFLTNIMVIFSDMYCSMDEIITKVKEVIELINKSHISVKSQDINISNLQKELNNVINTHGFYINKIKQIMLDINKYINNFTEINSLLNEIIKIKK